MDTRLYKVYHYLDTEHIDMNKFYRTIKWSIDGEFGLFEFKEVPHGNTQTLSETEAQELLNTPSWRHNL